MTNWSEQINRRLAPFKRKHFKRLLYRGLLISGGFILTYVLIAAFGESFLWLNAAIRTSIFFIFFLLIIYCCINYLYKPITWFLFGKGLKNEDAAKMIGQADHEVNDRLLNLIQLSQQSNSVLLDASINQRFSALQHISFERNVDLSGNRKYLPLLLIPLLLIFLFLAVNLPLFTGGISRLVQFNKEFTPQAPFEFEIKNQNLTAFRGEDFTLIAVLKGQSLPSELFLEQNELLKNFSKNVDGTFSFLFEKPQADMEFKLYSSGYYSGKFRLRVISRPTLMNLKSILEFPKYLNLKDQEINNSGNLEIPEGTIVKWLAQFSEANSAHMDFNPGNSANMIPRGGGLFEYQSPFFKDAKFRLQVTNDSIAGIEDISYTITVIPDELPFLQVKQVTDSISFNRIFVGGEISDDHGITRLELKWRKSTGASDEPYFTNAITINSALKEQDFLHVWRIDSIKLSRGETLEYFVEVWDNDGVHGPKSVRSGILNFKFPDNAYFDKQLSQSEQKTSGQIEEGKEKVKTLSNSIDEVRNRLRGKEMVDWQEKALLEDIIRQKEEMEKSLEELARQNQKLNEQREISTESDKRIMEKSRQLQELMENLLDEKTKELFKELEKLLRENANADQLQKMLDKIDRNEINIEKELDRIKELFKQLQLEAKLDQSIKRIQEQIELQESLLEKTVQKGADKENSEDIKELADEQEKIKTDWNQEEINFNEIRELAEEAGEDAGVPQHEQIEETERQMEESLKEIKSGQGKKSSEAQRRALKGMKEIKQKMEGRQEGMSMELDMEVMASLHQILHGLVKLSFDQESNMKAFGSVQSTDPAYLALSQNQIKLQDDSKVLIDSLLALGKKDMALGSFITRETGELGYHLGRSSEHIRERRKPSASSEMQLSMTSLNNLALMLNDHYQQMMEMVTKPGKGKGSKNRNKPSLSEMQQSLNEQIESVRKSGKTGKALSEELGKLAAEQERIRKALQRLQEKLEQEGGQKAGGELPGKMEQTELDLVNKNITEQTIRRQKEILNRLLESEKSVREQEFDEERKGETAKDYEYRIPDAFKDYLRIKEKEVEFLKTIPPKLYPYYKKEVNDYFERLSDPSKRNQ
jgi:hypothetical protein